MNIRFLTFLLCAFFMAPIARSYAVEGLPDFTKLVEEHGPAVVNISTAYKLPDAELVNDMFRQFLDFDGDRIDPNDHSLGSGYVISSDGFVVTNYHVIKDADEIVIRLSDQRIFTAEIRGIDERSDLALLKIDAEDLPVVKSGDSKKLKVGEWVFAIGSPFGFDHSVTVGVVSAKERSLPSESYVPYIQTDVAINPGNSGGPLFNLKGEVIGMNSQIFSQTGGFMGLSFAIPINVVNDVIKQLKGKGRVSRGRLGVDVQEVTLDLAKSFKMKKVEGALVTSIKKESSAKGVLKDGDIILAFAGERVTTTAMLPMIVGRMPIDQDIDVLVMRAGKEKTLTIKLTELPELKADPQELSAGISLPHDHGKPVTLGLGVEDIDDELRDKFDIEFGGVIVRYVKEGPAYNAGIQEGDIIAMMAGRQVAGSDDLQEMAKVFRKGDSVPVQVKRKGISRFVAIKIY
ncbi:MAG: HtrA protease/chaperone protein [uncultured Thiotrichaceae bacterium]|uniref:Probable periplasmic serine endoprotease DegP-like n=1 Tax=uncultured Thiotrichaceae bacterium TaxID=298394 RepID=A0A6S6TFS6_9GAMM|nr:MAG: HtrA protease/chaperone protein [uncultured Thiotrichaceae bacterium]